MREPVNPRSRPYHSMHRERQAAATREQILDAALLRFTVDGYFGASVDAIAETAGVALRTVYSAFPTKHALLAALAERAIYGGDPPATSITERSWYPSLLAEWDVRAMLRRYAQIVARVSNRVSPVQRVVRDAASSDPRIDAVWRQLKDQRLAGQRAIAELLAERGALRGDLDATTAGDVLWTLVDATVYDDLRERDWPDERIAVWLGDAMCLLLLGDALP